MRSLIRRITIGRRQIVFMVAPLVLIVAAGAGSASDLRRLLEG